MAAIDELGPVSDRLGAQAARLVEGLIDESARRGEALLAWFRLALCAALIARMVIFAWRPLADGHTRDVLDFAMLAGAAVGSGVVIGLLRRGRSLAVIGAISVGLDAALVFELLLTTIWWHTPRWTGLLGDVGSIGVMFALIALALRRSMRLIAAGIAANCASFAALLAIDRAVTPSLPYGAGRIALGWVLIGATAGLSLVLARRTRELVLSAATAMIETERVRQRFGAYVSAEVAEQSLQRGALALGGRRQDVAVLFSDLRGFTSWAEKEAPEALVAEMNAYFEAMQRAIRRYGGVIDKYIGDSIMVVFGVPSAGRNDAARAILTAVEMLAALEAHNADRATRGLPPLVQGVGVHYGPAIAGNIGTAERLQYTVVGDTVNLASRLQAATKEQGVSVLVSGAAVEAARMHEEVGLPNLVPAGVIRLRGREEPVAVFTL